jgi:CubicO group peptidase (beta-lactamase class C family)
MAATLIGAASQAGVPIDATTRVYPAMNGGSVPANLDERKRNLTLEHLLTMSSGLDCDDSDPASPGGEDLMQEQTEQPDWYRFTLDLKMIREPGEKSVYCSIQPNLAGGVLTRIAHRPLQDLFRDFVAEPLQIKQYWLDLQPTGEPYMGGGMQFLPRDFVKFAQLHLSGGTWNGRRVIGTEWARRATSPIMEMRGQRYGYLWWIAEYPYRDRTVRAFFAGGNGGQVAMGIPDLDLVIGFFGGNYSDSVLFVPQREYVPKYILPAISDASPKR